MKPVPCPQCQKPVDLSEKTSFRPFCSERCRLLDLGSWANEEYQINGQSLSDSLSDPDAEPTSEEEWNLH